MNNIKDKHAEKWIKQLTDQQVRALSCQWKLDKPMIRDIEQLKMSLLLIPAVCELAGMFDVSETIQTKKSRETNS